MTQSTQEKKKRIIAISMGDPGGVGPEVTLKALADKKLKAFVKKVRHDIVFCLLGSPDVYQEAAQVTNLSHPTRVVTCLDASVLSSRHVNILDLADDATEVRIGEVALANAALSYHALEVGAQLALHKVVSALVTAPINKEAVRLLSPNFTGHTEYLARVSKTKQFAMMLAGGPLRVILVTTHAALKDVPSLVTTFKVVQKIEIAHTFLKKQMKIRTPRIGVAALNPHAGEGGKIGTEEQTAIVPAIKRAQKKGIRVEGPIPADIIFHAASNGEYDAIIAMYHDQGLSPLKMAAFHTGVNVTLGLPFIRTSPDHGTAFDIAYKNTANPGSMIEAIKTAINLV